jgi:putative membrane protein
MITDHTKAAEELKSTAKSAGEKYVVPEMLDAKHQAMLDELKSADPQKFDAVYVRMQTDAHKEAVALSDGFANQGG